MTVNFEIPLINYLGNNSATEFAFLWSMMDANELFVTLDGLEQEVGVHYDLENLSLDNGGVVAFYVAPVQDALVTIFRQTPITQQIDYTFSPFPEDIHEGGFDKDTRILQEMFETGSGGTGQVNLSVAPGFDFVDIINSSGTDARIPSWRTDELLAGAFHGEVTEPGQAPDDGAVTTKPDGFIWFE